MSDIYADLVEEIRRLVAEGRIRATLDRDQAISFAYGNTHMSNPAVTREMVAAAYDRLHPPES